MKDMRYPIAECFASFQGEGAHAGRRAFFARLFGCNVKCPWCDSKSAWDGKPSETISASEIFERVRLSRAELAVITGGEPCLYDLSPLLELLNVSNIAAHLETSGTVEIAEREGAKFDWVALSPKLFFEPLESSLARADELKFIVSSVEEIELYASRFAARAPNSRAIWIHPQWDMSSDKKLLDSISGFVVENGGKYRAGWQMHKNYFAR